MSSWYWAVWLGVGVQRLVELRSSRRRERRLQGERACPRGYPLMVAAHVALFALPPLEVYSRAGARRRPGPWLLVLLFAGALRRWSVRSLGPQWNVRALVPDDFQPVVTGPYRLIRHPNYVAVTLEFLALPMAAGAWRSALAGSALNAGVLACRIRAEERLLARHPDYLTAFAGRRRFIPGVL